MTVAVAERTRPDRGIKYLMAEQTAESWWALGLGAGAMALLVLGPVAVVTSFGWTPPENLADGLGSTGMLAVLIAVIAIGLAAAALGFSRFRNMPTKSAKEAMISGAVLGIQAAVLSGVFLWVRAGDLELITRNFLDFELLGEFWRRFITGAKNTVILTVGGALIGIVGGLMLAVFAMSKRSVVRAPARVYINFFRGTPLIWQLSFAGLGVVAALRLDFTAYTVAMVVLGLNAAGYSAEVFRAGIQSLERGQAEAARALGMTYGQSLRYVILPQAVRRVIPPLTNEFVILIKDTSLVIVLGLTFAQKELLGAGRDIYSSTANATAFLGSAFGYLIITLPMIRLVTILEKKLRSGLTSVVG